MAVATPAPLLTVADLPRYAKPDRTLELVDGHLFVSALDTPFLELTIARVARVLREAAAGDPGTTVIVNRTFSFDERNLLIPDIAVSRDGAPLPDLVVEIRTDSTPRYALGPKRMVYGRAGIPEYWYLDPRAGSLAVLRRSGDLLDLSWPPVALASGESVRSLLLSRSIAVADLLGG